MESTLMRMVIVVLTVCAVGAVSGPKTSAQAHAADVALAPAAERDNVPTTNTALSLASDGTCDHEESACCTCIHGGSVDMHNFWGAMDCVQDPGPSCMDCSTGSGCHRSSEPPNDCSEKHDACDPDGGQHFTTLADAVVRGDRTLASSIVEANPSGMFLHDGYAVVLACDGRSVRAAIQMPRASRMERVAAAWSRSISSVAGLLRIGHLIPPRG